MKRFATLIAVVSVCLLVIPRGGARDDKAGDEELKGDLEKLQGKWERASITEGAPGFKVKRVAKEVKGNKNTVTSYDDKDSIISSHSSEFKLSRADKVRIFTFSILEIHAGPGNGQKVKGSGSYIYRLEKDTLYEAVGLLEEGFGRGQPYLATWKRVSEK